MPSALTFSDEESKNNAIPAKQANSAKTKKKKRLEAVPEERRDWHNDDDEEKKEEKKQELAVAGITLNFANLALTSGLKGSRSKKK